MTHSISYAITTHNEGESIQKLIERIKKHIDKNDELIILDDYSTDSQTLSILASEASVYKKKFNNEFSVQKNYLNSLCSSEYIFQFDGDELPSDLLLHNVKTFISQQPEIDLFWVPRDNRLFEINKSYIKRWGWPIDEKGRVNYPDYQGRLYRNAPEIYWTRPVHEIITGHKKQTAIPRDVGLDILHARHMSKQIESIKFYNENF